jgi:hypothetical protein
MRLSYAKVSPYYLDDEVFVLIRSDHDFVHRGLDRALVGQFRVLVLLLIGIVAAAFGDIYHDRFSLKD